LRQGGGYLDQLPEHCDERVLSVRRIVKNRRMTARDLLEVVRDFIDRTTRGDTDVLVQLRTAGQTSRS